MRPSRTRRPRASTRSTQILAGNGPVATTTTTPAATTTVPTVVDIDHGADLVVVDHGADLGVVDLDHEARRVVHDDHLQILDNLHDQVAMTG